jgi:hypothetical protein
VRAPWRCSTLLLNACDRDRSRKACLALAHVYAQRRQSALARTYFERGQLNLNIDTAYRAALSRAAHRKGSRWDDLTFWATAAFPLLALLALPHASESSYGFEEQHYADP